MIKDTYSHLSEGMQNFAYLEPYEAFLETKRVTARAAGIDVPLRSASAALPISTGRCAVGTA